MEKNPKLRIEIEADDRATEILKAAAEESNKFANSIKQTARAAEDARKKQLSFFSTLKSGTHRAGKYLEELDGRFKRLSSSIFNLKTAMATALGGLTIGKIVKDGIEFNAQLQTAKLGLSALITSSYELHNAQGQILSGMEAFKATQQEAEMLYRKILNRAMQTASTSRELLQTFQAILPFAANLGMNLEQVLNLSESLVNAAKAIGLGYGQAAQEGRDLLMGYVDHVNDQLLNALDLSTELLQTWQKQGTFYENVMQKFQPFVQASQKFADTWEGVTSSISDLISMLEGSVFKDTFRIMNEALKEVRDKLQEIINDEDKLNEISREVANKFIDTAEAIITTTNEVYQFGKTIYDFVNSHKEITEFGVLGYLLLGKKGALLGTVIGGILEVAERSKNGFPTAHQILKTQPNTKVVLGGSRKPELPSSESFKKFEEYKKTHKPENLSTLLPLPVKGKENTPKSIEFLEQLRQKINQPHQGKGEKQHLSLIPKPQPQPAETTTSVSSFDIFQNLTQSGNFSLLTPQTSLTEKLYEALHKQPLTGFSFGASQNFENFLTTAPDYSLDLQAYQLEIQKLREEFQSKFKEQYLEFAKEYHPEKWKQEKIEELKKWYEEQRKILGESAELQELYEHKKLEIEKEAHEQEKKLFVEKLKQTSKWKAGVFQSLDELSKKWGDTNQLIFEGTTRTFQALENSLETLFFDAMRGKLKSLGSYVNSFIREVESAIAGIAAQGVAKGVVGFAGKIFGFDLKTAANGDIFPGHFIPLQAFADGGVVNRPTLGLIGEGKYPEAIVPLPDGRSIPVKFEGKGTNGQVNIEIVLVDDRSKIPPPQIGKKQVVLWVVEDFLQNGITRKVLKP